MRNLSGLENIKIWKMENGKMEKYKMDEKTSRRYHIQGLL